MKLTVIVFALLPLWLLGQPDFRLCYHPYISQAELAIVDSNYRLAHESYRRAFSLVPSGFARDYQNAALCAMEAGELDFAVMCMEKLVAKGVQKNFFELNKSLYLPSLGSRYEDFMLRYDVLRQETFEKTYNSELEGQLGKLANRDQLFRNDYGLYYDSIQKIDAENIQQFIVFVEKFGFPTEEMLGVYQPFANNAIYQLMIWHHLKNWKTNPKLPDVRSILLDAVADGKLPPETATEYFDISESTVGGIGTYGSTGAVRFGDDPQYYVLDDTPEKTLLINENRKILGACSLEDFEKKLKYHFITAQKKSKYQIVLTGGAYYPEEALKFVKVRMIRG